MKNELLPIGSVVLLEGGTKKIMINGYFVVEGSNKKVWDYRGCPFPEGILESSGVELFDKEHEVIDFLDKLEIIKNKN